MPLWCQQSAMSSALSKLPLDNLKAGGGRPPTNRGPAAKPFIFYFALMSDACETTTLLSCLVDRCYSQAQLLFSWACHEAGYLIASRHVIYMGCCA